MCKNREQNQDFVHLHLHTEYSLLDGFARIDEAVNYAAELGMPALAITDHGTMFGVIDFYKACTDAHIKPIIGVEAYLAPRRRTDRDPQIDRKPYHLLLIAQNKKGYQNLLKLSSVAQLEGYYYNPRVDKDLLAQHAEGVIATSGCLAAEIPRLIELGKEDEARHMLGWYQDVFGKDNFFLELQQHDIPQIKILNSWLIENAGYANVPLVATNDVHYVRSTDYEAHDILLCIQTSSLFKDPNRLRFESNSFYLRSQHEMWEIFGAEAPESLWNTLLIAEMCEDLQLTKQDYHLPVFPTPAPFTDAAEFLRHLCERGLQWRFGERAHSPSIRRRLDHELEIIHRMGFDTYFLIVWDLCEYARHADIWWNVRGSGAGSLVAYSLGITALDPLENALIFERFLNPGRVSMPDFDLDFPEDRRAEMIDYCTRKYGEDKVAAIITFGTLAAKGAIRDVGRVLDMPLSEVNRIAAMVPTVAKPPKINQLLGLDEDKPELKNPDFTRIYEDDPYVRRVIDLAMAVEGVPRHASTHAAGLIVADRPLVEYIPLHRPTKNTESDDNPVKMVTQFPMETAESIGLLKIDFLGLSTLTILRKACDLIARHHGIAYNMENIPIQPDPANPEITRRVEQMFEMLGRGESIGVFQLESSGMRQMLTGMRPKTFEHIIAAISLYRPGPMQFIDQFNRRLHGEEGVVYLHPALEPIIGNTYGIITYQEQLMQIAADLFGYSMAEADLMRRAVSKKKQKDLEQHRSIFIERGPDHGVDTSTAEAIFEQIAFFANYGFNKSHAADYAAITCKTAYLKCHYPHEYMTALLSVYRDDSDKVSLFIADCRRMHIDVLPPSLNASQLDFDIETHDGGKRSIRFGLGAVKNVGVGPVEHIIEERHAGGRFIDLDDFLNRCDLSTIGKRALESMIKSGALDEFGDRSVLLHNLERLLSYNTERRRAAAAGQTSMFDLLGGQNTDYASVWGGLETPRQHADKREQLRWEKELLGVYVSDHPLGEISRILATVTSDRVIDIKDPATTTAGKAVMLIGLVAGLRQLTTKNNDTMAIVQVEDDTGYIDCVFFPRTWTAFRADVKEDEMLIVWGKADERNGEMQILVERAGQRLEYATAHVEPPAAPMAKKSASPKASSTPPPAPKNTNGNTRSTKNGIPTPPPAPVYAATSSDIAADEMEPDPFDDAPLPFDEYDIPPEDDYENYHAPLSYPLQNKASTAVEVRQYTPSILYPTPAYDSGEFYEQAVEASRPPRRLTLYLPRIGERIRERRRLDILQGIFTSYPGKDSVRILVETPPRETPLQINFSVKIDICEPLLDDLRRSMNLDDSRIEIQDL